MALLLFHGEEILGLFAGVVVGAIGFASMILWLFNRPPRNAILPAIIYFLIASIPGILFLLSDEGYILLLAVIFTFPWSVLFVLLATFLDVNFGNLAALLGAFLNAILFYIVGRLAKSWSESTRGTT